jgi:hypothetical protein
MCLARNSGLSVNDCIISLSLDFVCRWCQLGKIGCSSGLPRQPLVVFAVNGLFGSPQQLVEVARPEQPVVVYGMPEFGDFSLAAPITKGVAAHPEVLSRFMYLQELIQLRHPYTPC